MQANSIKRSMSFAARLTAAALLSLWLAELLGLRMPLWVVLTAILVSQTNLGRSLKVALDYFVGTLLGAIWGALLTALIAQTHGLAVGLTLAVAIAPLGVIAALEPRFTAAPLTAAIIVLGLQISHLTPVTAALERLSEVGLGGVVGLLVSFGFFRSSAFHLVRERAADVLVPMSDAATFLLKGAETGLPATAVQQHHKRLGDLLAVLATAVSEAERERSVLMGGDDAAPLYRALLRLRHDLIIIGRAVENPLPVDVSKQLSPVYTQAGEALRIHFVESAAALRARKPSPPSDRVDAAIEACGTELDALRQAQSLRGLSGDDLEHVFAAGFALEQMRRNISDLELRINAWGKA